MIENLFLTFLMVFIFVLVIIWAADISSEELFGEILGGIIIICFLGMFVTSLLWVWL